MDDRKTLQRKAPPQSPPRRWGNTPVSIERRMVVATIEPDELGEHPMMRAVFMAASDVLAGTLTDSEKTDTLEFVYGPHRYRITAEADREQ